MRTITHVIETAELDTSVFILSVCSFSIHRLHGDCEQHCQSYLLRSECHQRGRPPHRLCVVSHRVAARLCTTTAYSS